jgi:Ca2+-binding EF-hand superfamily protein
MLDSKRTDGGIDEGELTDHIAAKLRETGDPTAKMKAKVAAKMAIHTLDGDGDGKIDADELTSFAADALKRSRD